MLGEDTLLHVADIYAMTIIKESIVSKFRTAFLKCAHDIVIGYIINNSRDVYPHSVYRSKETLTAEIMIIKYLEAPYFYNSFVNKFNFSTQINESFSGKNNESVNFDRSKFRGETRDLFD